MKRIMATWSQIGFQDSSSPIMEELTMFHDFNMVILSFILVLVGWFLVVGVMSNLSVLNISERHVIECVWTFFRL